MRGRWRISLQVSPRLFVESPSGFRINHVVEVFTAFELLFFSLTNLLTAMDGSLTLLSLCQILVMQSFAFSFRISKVRSLIKSLSRSFCIQRENPMLWISRGQAYLLVFVFMHIPLSLCRQLVVCRRERLHVTAFGKTAILSLERASNCTNMLYSGDVSKYSGVGRFLVLSSRLGIPFSICIIHRIYDSEEHSLSSSFKTSHTSLPGINPFPIIEFSSLAFPTW